MVVALGLLAGVVLSMAGLVIVGNRWVVAGRHSSEATALACDAIEEIEGWGFRETWARFGCVAGSATCGVSTSHPELGSWRTRAIDGLPGGDFAVTIDAVGDPRLDRAPGLRVTVLITWSEGTRPRELRVVRVRT